MIKDKMSATIYQCSFYRSNFCYYIYKWKYTQTRTQTQIHTHKHTCRCNKNHVFFPTRKSEIIKRINRIINIHTVKTIVKIWASDLLFSKKTLSFRMRGVLIYPPHPWIKYALVEYVFLFNILLNQIPTAYDHNLKKKHKQTRPCKLFLISNGLSF